MPPEDAQLATLVEWSKSVDAKLGRILSCVDGYGDDPGMRVRLDRLEQSESTRKWAIRAVSTGLFGIIVERIHALFSGRH